MKQQQKLLAALRGWLSRARQSTTAAAGLASGKWQVASRDRRHFPLSTCHLPPPPQRELFDELTLLLARPLPRRQALKLAGLAVAAAFLMRVGIKPAFAQSNCSCNGLPLRRGEAC